MKFWAIALMLIFLLVATVGFAVMCQDMGMTGGMMASYHISIYQAFTNVTVASFTFCLALFALILVVFLNIASSLVDDLLVSLNTFSRWIVPDILSVSKRKITHFLALLENSPSLA